MEYTIGEVAEILHLSRDMIRYYEKQGAIQSHRNPGNNYRTYDIFAIFWLLEAVRHKNFGINIKDISQMRSANYEEQIAAHLEAFAASLEKESQYKLLLARKSRQIKEKKLLAEDNIGHYWHAIIPAMYKTTLVIGQGDDYEKITLGKQESELVFSDEYNPFFDSTFTFDHGKQIWQMAIEEEYVKTLGIILPSSFAYVPSHKALCTNIDIGEIDHFNTSLIDGFLAYARKNMDIFPEVTGLLVSRGISTSVFHRIVELHAF